ncbi:uncharacterized protein LOC114562455 [Perca flavescens]|uniref:uncharacterized protein LOC114562455 n=1 Tax=Perca flavescens TaxID=8167 RepID=UPI00106E00CC|nr:uncharacterized protein LOC114562455 [Perca flavescens]
MGIQASVSCRDFGVGPSNADPLCLSSTPIKRPPKRPRLDLDEDLEDNPLEGSSLVFKAMKLQLFRYETFCRHARSFIEPAVIHHWKVTQDVNLQRLCQEEKVILGGDMRADSPGHSAKYGSYTTMDLQCNTIVDIQLVQSNEVGGSYHMEKEDLTRSLALLESRGVKLDCIVTDRHPQVQKFLRERNITHYYDVWHMAKGISKKLEAISKQKDSQKERKKLKKWMKSINNHIYWTAASSTSGPERIAKWTAILNHVRDVHTHEDPL